jgi:dihydropteroate synthase
VLKLAILNLNADSFSDADSQLIYSAKPSVSKLKFLIENGAKYIDMGCESTRPGAEPSSIAADIALLERFTEALLAEPEELTARIRFSIDTYKPEVLKWLFEHKFWREKIFFINSVKGFSNLTLLEACLQAPNPLKLKFITMHSKGGVPPSLTAAEVPDNYYSQGLFEELTEFYLKNLQYITKLGFGARQLILDPGLGFGKNLKHSFEVLPMLTKLKNRFADLEILVGSSRKSFLKLALVSELEHFKPYYEYLELDTINILIKTNKLFKISKQSTDNFWQENTLVKDQLGYAYDEIAVKLGADYLRVHNIAPLEEA